MKIECNLSGIRSGLIPLFFILYLSVFSCSENSEIDYHNWTTYSGDPTGSKYTELDEINKENVKDLKVAWTFQTRDMRENPPSTIQCNPIIIDKTMYLTSPALKVIAINAASGEEIWRFDPFEGEGSYGENRGVVYWTDGVVDRIFYVAGSWLYSLQAKSGNPVLNFGDSGKVDLYEGLGREVHHLWITASTPGMIYKDMLILGSRVGEGPGPTVPGHIRAFDVRTGKIRWIFETIPKPGDFGHDTWPEDAWEKTGGANSWGGLTLDEKRGIIFFGTGSASYDHYGGDRHGSNLFANCVLALDANTGKRKWHYQVVHHDIWDYDLPCPPNLVQVEKNGQIIDAVAQPTKMGHLFILDRVTGKPVFPIEEIPVPQSEIPDEKTWPTQPFPSESLRYGQQTFLPEDITDISPESRKSILEKIYDIQLGDVFLPPSFKGSIVLPQFNGGTNWGGAAYDPEAHILYVNCSNEAEWISIIPSRPEKNISKYQLGQRLYGTICSACHGYGNPRNPGSPSLEKLKEIKLERSRYQIDSVIQHGKGQMPKLLALTGLERESLIDFLWDEGKDSMINKDSVELSFAENMPFVATGHNSIRDHEGYPANKPPWGTLNAISMDQGEILWQVPLGTYPELEKRGFPATGTFNMGGPLVTGGGLVFIGATMDERFRAFDTDSGKIRWEYQLNAGAYSTPASYEIDGIQYIVIAAGGAGKPETKPGDLYYCFALDK